MTTTVTDHGIIHPGLPNSRIKIVIFDCDGVMFDSRDANRCYYNDLLAHFGHPRMDADDLAYVHAHNVMDSVARIFRAFPEEINAVHAWRRQLDYAPYLSHMLLEPDLKDFLTFLKPDIRTAISTNRTTTMPQVMELFGLETLFDKVVTALDVACPKPHPEALHKILDAFGLQPGDAVYIGDSTVDQAHAAALAIPLIAFKNPLLQADLHVSSFTEIMCSSFFNSHDPAP